MGGIRLYFRLLGAHGRALLEYETDFWIMAVATAFMQVVNIVFLAALFARVPQINGWTFWLVVVMFGMVSLAEGVSSLLSQGVWNLARLIDQGELDYLLVRPYPVVLQVTSSEIATQGLSYTILGGLMVGVALGHIHVDWTLWRVLFGIVLLAGAIAIKMAINLSTNAVSFWLPSATSMFAVAMNRAGELARFPLSVYPLALKAVLGFVVPFAFISYFPVASLAGTGPSRWTGLLTPLVAVYCVVVALTVFRRGLRRYESAGN